MALLRTGFGLALLEHFQQSSSVGPFSPRLCRTLFLSLKMDIHGPGVQATRVLYAQHHLHVHFASTCCSKYRGGVLGLDEDCSHVNILGHTIEKSVSES